MKSTEKSLAVTIKYLLIMKMIIATITNGHIIYG
jgi:hypothetical protein